MVTTIGMFFVVLSVAIHVVSRMGTPSVLMLQRFDAAEKQYRL